MGYSPGVPSVGAAERLGGQLSGVAIRFDDHPTGKRFAGRIEPVAADSVFAWMRRAELAGTAQVVEGPAPR